MPRFPTSVAAAGLRISAATLSTSQGYDIMPNAEREASIWGFRDGP
jgi:hypothetical protein